MAPVCHKPETCRARSMYNSAQNSLAHSVDPILGCDRRPPQPGFTFHHFNLLTALPHPFRLNVGSPMFHVERSARSRFTSTRYDTLRHVYHARPVTRRFYVASLSVFPPFGPVKQFRHRLAPEPGPSQSDPIRLSILHLFFALFASSVFSVLSSDLCLRRKIEPLEN